MADQSDPAYPASRTRRQFLQDRGATLIEHIMVCRRENHSFDHYFGAYPGPPEGYGTPPGFTQPDGHGGMNR